MFIFIFIVLVLIVPFKVFGADSESLNFSNETPAAFFNSGIECYYFSPEGMRELKYEDSKDNRTESNKEISDFTDLKTEFDIHFVDDGSAVMVKKNKNYACADDSKANCISGDGVIENIEVINLTGKRDTSALQNHIEIKQRTKVKFGIGSKMYALKTTFPEYNFTSFTDFDKLSCIKDEENNCVNFNKDDQTDVAALLGFHESEENLLIKNTGDSSFIYDEQKSKILKADTECFDNKGETECQTTEAASVEKIQRPDGLDYFMIKYADPKAKKEIYFTDSNGQGFKIYLNEKRDITIHMLNKTAAEIVRKAF